MTSPIVSSVAAHTKADEKFASWKRQYGISKMPATSGTTARNGPKNRPMKNAGNAPFLHEGLPARDQTGVAQSGHMCATEYSSFKPTQ